MVVQEYEVNSFVVCYHEYRKTWTPITGDVLQCQMEPDNAEGKYVVAVMNKDRAAGHLMEEKSSKFAKIVSFFLRDDVSNMAAVKINGKAVRKGEGNRMEVLCTIIFTGSKQI